MVWLDVRARDVLGHFAAVFSQLGEQAALESCSVLANERIKDSGGQEGLEKFPPLSRATMSQEKEKERKKRGISLDHAFGGKHASGRKRQVLETSWPRWNSCDNPGRLSQSTLGSRHGCLSPHSSSPSFHLRSRGKRRNQARQDQVGGWPRAEKRTQVKSERLIERMNEKDNCYRIVQDNTFVLWKGGKRRSIGHLRIIQVNNNDLWHNQDEKWNFKNKK